MEIQLDNTKDDINFEHNQDVKEIMLNTIGYNEMKMAWRIEEWENPKEIMDISCFEYAFPFLYDEEIS